MISRRRDSSHPESLEAVETQHRRDFATHGIKSVILSGFEDTEEKEPCQSCAPDHDEQAVNDLTSIVLAVKGQGNYGQDDKVGAAGNIVEAVSLESHRYHKEECLIS